MATLLDSLFSFAKYAVEAFMRIYGDEYAIVHRGYRLIITKGERS